MRLSDADGQWVSLAPSGYQYPNLSREKWNGWDENWLQITGDVSCDGGKHWSFRDAGLTASEAKLIAPWLRRALRCLSPVARALLFGECPPWLSKEEGDIWGFFVQMEVRPSDLE
jgi:hypothetical protein